MSIPPLVCSTPPPPEQCEDDKDPDDFVLNYNLSQEDDSSDYDYGNFSNFNHFQTSTSESCQEIISKSPIVNRKDVSCDEHIQINQVQLTQGNVGVETSEDDIIEDLDLKIDQEPVIGGSKSNKESDINHIEHSVKDNDIPLNSAITQDEVNLSKSCLETNALNCNGKLEMVANENIDQKIESSKCYEDTTDIAIITNSETNSDVEENVTDSVPQGIEDNIVQEKTDSNNLNDFDDFDDFQFSSSNNKQEIILDSIENPWQNEVSQNNGFEEFTADFATNEETSFEGPFQKDNDSEDDFGDFDEFKSVDEIRSSTSALDKTLCEEVSVLNLQSSDSEHQIIERINKVMQTIFEQEVLESESIFENGLEGLLGETWGYLLETDVRQPYIVNWNSSLAQKTLLKALCIDSRNILFGPKWSSNMPKYAANLSTAPLQPQKQSGQLSTSQSEAGHHPDKAENKTSWADPFTSDGQESCSTENENVIMETGPTDLDVFEANVPTKTDKIYSNTLSIQPLRQISLPDTHIFTPTNSETPRSKTIHYDNISAPAGLIPKSDTIPQQTHSSENDNDYWEFQDFRGANQSKDLPSTANAESKVKVIDAVISEDINQKVNYTIETQVLQPVKLDLVMPTLNWPEPGEVKETFDDFTVFMSNSSHHDEKIESASQSVTKLVSKNIDENLSTCDKLDDDFEIFQSAVPPIKSTTGISNVDRKLVHDNATAGTLGITSNLSDFDVVFATTDKDKKSENISLPSTRPIEILFENVNNTNMNELIFGSPTIPPVTVPSANVLQPTIATPSGTKPSQQKMDQILQPLSLESYSQINWPNPGINLQDLSRFNPVESLQSLKSETRSQSKTASPVHSQKGLSNNQASDDDIWGEFVSSKPKQQTLPKKATTFSDDDEWTDFVSSPINPHNGLKTISLNVHTNSGLQKSNTSKYQPKVNEIPLDIPTLNYITPKTTSQTYNERHFQNL